MVRKKTVEKMIAERAGFSMEMRQGIREDIAELRKDHESSCDSGAEQVIELRGAATALGLDLYSVKKITDHLGKKTKGMSEGIRANRKRVEDLGENCESSFEELHSDMKNCCDSHHRLSERLEQLEKLNSDSKTTNVGIKPPTMKELIEQGDLCGYHIFAPGYTQSSSAKLEEEIRELNSLANRNKMSTGTLSRAFYTHAKRLEKLENPSRTVGNSTVELKVDSRGLESALDTVNEKLKVSHMAKLSKLQKEFDNFRKDTVRTFELYDGYEQQRDKRLAELEDTVHLLLNHIGAEKQFVPAKTELAITGPGTPCKIEVPSEKG